MILSDVWILVRCYFFMCLSVAQLLRSHLYFRLHFHTFTRFEAEVKVSNTIIFIIDRA